MMQLLSILTILLYLTVAGLQAQLICPQQRLSRMSLAFLTAWAAVGHAMLLYFWIDTPQGQNLAFFNVMSQVLWFSVVALWLASLRKPIASLGIFLYPLAALSILLASVFPGKHIVPMGLRPGALFHIILAMVTFSVLGLAAIQALLLAIEERLLRHKRYANLMEVLPPLETMEKLLFQVMTLGFVLLSMVILTSPYIFAHIFSQHISYKLILTMMAWFIFASLLAGRYYLGWRGTLAIRWTISGVGLLLLLLVISSMIR